METTIKSKYNELLCNNKCKITKKCLSQKYITHNLYVNDSYIRNSKFGATVFHRLEVLMCYIWYYQIDFQKHCTYVVKEQTSYTWWSYELMRCNILAVCQCLRSIMPCLTWQLQKAESTHHFTIVIGILCIKQTFSSMKLLPANITWNEKTYHQSSQT
jgi:hypothetical protein